MKFHSLRVSTRMLKHIGFLSSVLIAMVAIGQHGINIYNDSQQTVYEDITPIQA